MTAGNRVQEPTPFMTSLNTGGPDPTAGKGNPDINADGGVVELPQVGADAEAPAGSVTLSENGYGCDRSGNMSMMDMQGPGSEETTFGTTNADASGNTSMQDMSGASLGEPTKAMNTDAGRGLPGQGNDHNWNPMSQYQ